MNWTYILRIHQNAFCYNPLLGIRQWSSPGPQLNKLNVFYYSLVWPSSGEGWVIILISYSTGVEGWVIIPISSYTPTSLAHARFLLFYLFTYFLLPLFLIKFALPQATILVLHSMSPWICGYLWKSCWCCNSSNRLPHVYRSLLQHHVQQMPNRLPSASIRFVPPAQPTKAENSECSFVSPSLSLPPSDPAISTCLQNPFPSLIPTATELFQTLINLFPHRDISSMFLPSQTSALHGQGNFSK